MSCITNDRKPTSGKSVKRLSRQKPPFSYTTGLAAKFVRWTAGSSKTSGRIKGLRCQRLDESRILFQEASRMSISI